MTANEEIKITVAPINFEKIKIEACEYYHESLLSIMTEKKMFIINMGNGQSSGFQIDKKKGYFEIKEEVDSEFNPTAD